MLLSQYTFYKTSAILFYDLALRLGEGLPLVIHKNLLRQSFIHFWDTSHFCSRAFLAEEIFFRIEPLLRPSAKSQSS